MPITKLLYSFIENGPLTGSLFGTASYALDSVYSASLASRSTILESASSSFSTRVTNLVTDSGSFSTRAATLEIASGSFSTRITNLVTDSGSFSTRAATLETASSSFSTRVTNLISDSGSFSTRVTNLVTDSSSFSNRTATLETASGSFSTRVTNLVTDSSSFSARLSSYTGSIFGTASYATKAETLVSGININAGLITASAISVTTLSVVTITSSIDYASGSNIFGTKSTDTQLFTGSVSMSGSLSVVGNITSNNVLSLASGTVALPSLILSTDTTSGMYRIGANNIGISISAAKVLDISSTGLSVTGALSSTGEITANTNILLKSGNDLRLYNTANDAFSQLYNPGGSGAHQLAVRLNGTNVATFTSTGLNSTAIGATTPSTGAFTTLSASSTLDVGSTSTLRFTQLTNNDQSNCRLRFINTGSGGQTWDILGGTNGASNAGLGFLNGSTTYMQLSTTGLAVTGTLSATSTVTSAIADKISLSGVGASDQYFLGANYTNADGTESVTNAARASWRFRMKNVATNEASIDFRAANAATNAFTAIGTFSSTGLAVTGALSASGSTTLGGNGIGVTPAGTLNISDLNDSTARLWRSTAEYLQFAAARGGFTGQNNVFLLDIVGNPNVRPFKIRQSSNGGSSFADIAEFSTSGLAVTGAITATGNITAYFSDDRLKTKLGKIENALDKICSLEGFYYEANDLAQSLGYKAVREVGISAQSVQSVLPEIVKPAPIDSKYLTIQYERTVPLIIEAIKELRNEINAFKK